MLTYLLTVFMRESFIEVVVKLLPIDYHKYSERWGGVSAELVRDDIRTARILYSAK